MKSPDPWLYLREHFPNVKVLVRFMPRKQWGRVEWTDPPTIIIRPTLGRIARRAVLWHEIAHVTLNTNDEDAVSEWTARWMLPDVAEIGRLVGQMDVRDAAHELGVTRRVLLDRLACLDDTEKRTLAVVMGAD